MENFDYIIIGAGSAGCVLANRLSSNPKKKIFGGVFKRRDYTNPNLSPSEHPWF